jgi:hypothetical protein
MYDDDDDDDDEANIGNGQGYANGKYYISSCKVCHTAILLDSEKDPQMPKKCGKTKLAAWYDGCMYHTCGKIAKHRALHACGACGKTWSTAKKKKAVAK